MGHPHARASLRHRLPRGALDGAEVAYYLVHSLDSPDFERRDRIAAETVAREAAAAGIRQIVYLGGLGDDSPDLSAHLPSRIQTGIALESGPVPATTLRAAMVIGVESAAFEAILALVDRLPAMICPRWVSTGTQPIALNEVVRYLSEVCAPVDLAVELVDQTRAGLDSALPGLRESKPGEDLAAADEQVGDGAGRAVAEQHRVQTLLEA